MAASLKNKGLQLLGTLSPDSGANTGLVSGLGGQIIISTWGGRIEVWHVEKMKRIQSLAFPAQENIEIDDSYLRPFAQDSPREKWSPDFLPIAHVCISGNGRLFAAAVDNTVRLFQLKETTGELEEWRTLEADGSAFTSVYLDETGSRLLATSAQRGTFIWNLRDNEISHEFELHSTATACLIHENTQTVFVAEDTGYITGFSLQENGQIGPYEAHKGAIWKLVTGPGQLLFSGGIDGTVRTWSEEQASPEIRCIKHRGLISDVHSVREGRYLFTSSFDGSVGLWEPKKNALVGFCKFPRPIYRLCPLDDGCRVVIASAQSLELFDYGSALGLDRLPPRTTMALISLDENEVESPFETDETEGDATPEEEVQTTETIETPEIPDETGKASPEPAKKAPERLTAPVSTSISSLLVSSDLLLSMFVGIIAGGLSWAALFLSNNNTHLIHALGAGASAAVTLFASTQFGLVLIRWKRLKTEGIKYTRKNNTPSKPNRAI